MVDVSSQNNSVRINVSSSGNSSSIKATPDTAQYYSEKSREWAVSNKIVDNIDYSSKYYAGKAGVSENNAKNYAQNTQNLYNQVVRETDDAISQITEVGSQVLVDINDRKTEVNQEITNSKNTAIAQITTKGAEQIANIESTGFYMRDDKLYFIDSKGEEQEFQSGGSGFSLFDTRTLDYELPFEQSEGWALQGTYVYKNAVAGSRYGYPDFYNKCLQEKELGVATEITLGDNTITMYVNGNGHQFYDIADKEVVDVFYNAMGMAWFYGIDTENERVFLPRNDYFEQMTGDVSLVGTAIEAGLPDHQHAPLYVDGSNADAGDPGKLIDTSYVQGNGIQTNTNGYTGMVKGSSIYGNSNTVQPNAVKKLLYICVGNTKVESAVTDITEITTSENDTLPLFHNFYSKEDMTTTGAYVNASLGSWLSGNVYATAYNELVKKLGTDNVKTNTDSYTDYDFVVNQDDMTFRLPLKNGQEIMFAIGVKGNGMTLGLTNGTTNAGLGNISISSNVALRGDTDGYGMPINSTVGSNDFPSDKSLGITTDSTKSGIVLDTENITIPDGWNLYYKLANAVENLEILDVGKVMSEAVLRSSLVDANSYVSGLAMPSNKYIDLTLGASGAEYTAPANGWVILQAPSSSTSSATATLSRRLGNATMDGAFTMRCFTTGTKEMWMYCYIPVKKGEIFYPRYSNVTASSAYFRFIYAEGEV